MEIRALSQLNYRNLLTPRLEFSSGINAIVGANAAGKSNVLECAYLGCTGQLPHGHISHCLRHGTEQGFVSSQLACHDGLNITEIGLGSGRKVIRLNGQHVRAHELARSTTAVLITPEDADLVHGSPSRRRAYLDSLLSRLSPRYAVMLKEYQRVLEQRNALLKHAPHDPSLQVWSDSFISLGSELMTLRLRAVQRLDDISRSTYAEISGGSKNLSLTLKTGDDPDLSVALHQSQAEERARGVTVVGPHRDDLLLTLNDYSIQDFGSRGEARTTALALRVAEYQLLGEKHQEAPVLLIDDFSAELDASRRAYLLALAARTPQTLISGTDAPPQYQQLCRIAAGEVKLV